MGSVSGSRSDPVSWMRCYRTRMNSLLRKAYLQYRRLRLRLPGAKRDVNRITLISCTCLGGVMLSDLGMRFNSPFVDLWLYPTEYIRLCADLDSYMRKPLEFISDEHDYPVALLGDVRIFFRHYSTEKEAADAWQRRTARMDRANLFFILTERNGCSYEDMRQFDRLPYAKKAIITAREYPEIGSAVYLKGFADEARSGIGTRFKRGGVRRYIDGFDYVKWFRSK